MAIALAAVVSLVSGYVLVAAGWPRSHASLSVWLMKLSLAAGFGLGTSSAAYFAGRMVAGDHFLAIDLFLLTALVVLYILARRRTGPTASPDPVGDIAASPGLSPLLIGSFVIAIAAALYDTVARVLAHPHGDGWDAFAIWNLHARFLFRGGSHWRDGFNALIPWSHPDYPLLVPAATARFWSYLGHDSPAVPAIIGLVYTFSAITLSMSSLWYLRGRNASLLAGITLSATPFFAQQGAAQYEDVPLSFFILATIVLLHFGFQHPSESRPRHSRGPWALAGLSASFAAWTKNEGLLFLIAMFAAYAWVFRRTKESEVESSTRTQRSRDLLIPALLGASPILAVIEPRNAQLARGDPQVIVTEARTSGRGEVELRPVAGQRNLALRVRRPGSGRRRCGHPEARHEDGRRPRIRSAIARGCPEVDGAGNAAPAGSLRAEDDLAAVAPHRRARVEDGRVELGNRRGRPDRPVLRDEGLVEVIGRSDTRRGPVAYEVHHLPAAVVPEEIRLEVTARAVRPGRVTGEMHGRTPPEVVTRIGPVAHPEVVAAAAAPAWPPAREVQPMQVHAQCRAGVEVGRGGEHRQANRRPPRIEDARALRHVQVPVRGDAGILPVRGEVQREPRLRDLDTAVEVLRVDQRAEIRCIR